MADLICADGFTVDRRQIVLDKPIKTLGVHEVKVQLHPEVQVKVKINIARSQDEADRQARGEDVTVIKDEAMELETYNPDEMFEDGVPPDAPGSGEQPDV